MIIYRPHRGSLNDSLQESKVFDNYGELFKYIVMSWDNLFDTSDIRLLHIDNDTRIGWNNVFYVCTKRFGAEICSYPQCVGIMATHWTARGEKEV